MTKNYFLILFALITISSYGQKTNFHSFSAKTIDGKEISMSQFKGKKVLIVNVASKCGLTSQYEKLQELNLRFGGDKFVIIGFPANDFLSQEPGSNNEIKTFCTEKYGVTFQMMEKISVKGDHIHPIYKWLTQKSENGFENIEVKWNFQKFLVDENGNLIRWFPPKTDPLNEELIKSITAL